MSESGEEGEEDEEEGDDLPQEAVPDDGEGSDFDELQVGQRTRLTRAQTRCHACERGLAGGGE